MEVEKIETGIEGLDEILYGGFFKNHSHLILGESGVGKTILALQFLINQKQQNKKCLLITLDRSYEDIELTAKSFKWDIKGIDFLDLSEFTKNSKEYKIFYPEEIEPEDIYKVIFSKVENSKPEIVVIDSATILKYIFTNELFFKKSSLYLTSFLNSKGCTSIITFNIKESNKDNSLELACDCVISLNRRISEDRAVEFKTMEVLKFKYSNYLNGLHTYYIDNKGFHIYPRKISPARKLYIEKPKMLSTGIPQLDILLGGGLESSTSTLISGPTGIGKTTLGLSIICSNATKKNKGLVLSFEENPETMIYRASNLNIPVKKLIEEGSIKFIKLSPINVIPNQIHWILENEIKNENLKMLLIDTLEGYMIAMERFGALKANFNNIINMISFYGVTTIILNEVENISGEFKISELGISYLVDNAIIMKYVEIDSEIKRFIGCIKKRLGIFQPEIREFQITEKGIKIGEKLKGYTGILTGKIVNI